MALTSLPNPGQNLAQTRDPIRINFDNINNNFLVNHVELNSGADSGKHTRVQFVNYPTAFNNGPNEFALFSNNGALNLLGPNQASAAAVNLTTRVNSPVNGYYRLFNGLLVKYGRITTTVAGAQAVPFPTGGGVPAFAAQPLIVLLQQAQSGSALNPRIITWNYNGTTPTDLAVVVTDANGNAATAEIVFWALAIG